MTVLPDETAERWRFLAAVTEPLLRRKKGWRRKKDEPNASRTLVSDLDVKRSRYIYYAVLSLVVIVFTVVFVSPYYWMIISGVKSSQEIVNPTPSVFPHHFHWGTYYHTWGDLSLGTYFKNTVIYAVGGWLIKLVVDVLFAYAISKLRPVFGKVVFGMVVATLMLPATALVIPAFRVVADVPIFHVSLINTPWALWLPGAADAVTIYLLKRFFDQLPDELLDAAKIDGAGRLRILWNIVLPLSRPVIAVVSILTIIGIWKDFLWPLLVLQSSDKWSLSVALVQMRYIATVPQNELMAALVLSSLPMYVIFLFFQKQILGGLTAGAIKG